jgi:hypothetical protein
MPDINWTPSQIEERFIDAADVMRRLPDVRVPGYFSTWPTVLREFADLIGQQPMPMRRPQPSAEAIGRMEEALEWLRWLKPDDAKLVWMRAQGVRWREVCHHFGIARATAHRRLEYTLLVIVWRLERRPLPQKWSRRYLRERARASSSAA